MAAHERATTNGRTRDDGVVPVLEARPGGPAQRFAGAMEGRHPAVVFFAAVLAGFVVLAGLAILLGLFVTDVLVHTGGIGRADESAVESLVRDRTGVLTDVSSVGSDGGRRAGAADPGRPDRDRLRDQAPAGGSPRSPCSCSWSSRRPTAWRRCVVPRDRPHVAPARGPSGRRELPVRPHRRVDRRLLRSRAAAHVGVPEGPLARRGLGGRAAAAAVRRRLAHVPRHAPPARRRRRAR